MIATTEKQSNSRPHVVHGLRPMERKGESWALMVMLLAGLTLLFFLVFFNRFSGLRSGDGEFGGGMALLSGRLPYRDYFTAGPPLNTLKSALLLKVFSQALIVNRLAGVAERIVMGIVLLRWLIQLFRPWHALVASVVTMIVSAGDLTDPIASYNHDAVLFAMFAGLFASIALERRSATSVGWLGVLSGASAAFSLLTKQTVGLGALALVGLVSTLLLLKVGSLRYARRWCAAYLAGCTVPIAGVATWLWRAGILRDALRMMFVTGPSAKAGHPGDFLIRSILIGIINWRWILSAAALIAFSWKAILRGLKLTSNAVSTSRERIVWVVSGVALILIAEALAFSKIPVLQNSSKAAVYYAWVGGAVLLFAYVQKAVAGPINVRTAQIIVFLIVGWSNATMLSLSWPAFEPMTLPGLGLMLAAWMDGAEARWRWVPALTMAALVFFQVREKLNIPFGFEHYYDAPVRSADASSNQRQLQGMRLPPETVRFLDRTSALVAERTSPGDPIFTYPEMGLIYSLTNRWPPTWAPSHNIDVVNDALARQDAERLLRNPPKVIVYYHMHHHELKSDEAIWRNGAPSGQRDIIAAITELLPQYQLADSYVLAPHDAPLEVYVRR